MLSGFRDFVMRGNIIDLAVALVIGLAFAAVLNSFVADILTPLLGLLGVPDFSTLTLTVGRAEIRYGAFLNALIAFLSIAAVVYFFVVQPVNVLMDRLKPGKPVDTPTRACPECVSDIPITARRCAFCSSEVAPAA